MALEADFGHASLLSSAEAVAYASDPNMIDRITTQTTT